MYSGKDKAFSLKGILPPLQYGAPEMGSLEDPLHGFMIGVELIVNVSVRIR